MKQEDFARAYEPIPQALEYRVKHTLSQLTAQEQPVHRRKAPAVALALVLVVLLGSVAYAVIQNRTAELFGWMYGNTMQAELEKGDRASMGQSTQLGDVTYTVEEMVYKTESDFAGLYGVIHIAPAEGANVVLVAEDYSVNDYAGYLLYYGDEAEVIAEDAPSYAELAQQRNAKLLRVRASVDAITANGTAYGDCVGQTWLPQADGTVLGMLEIPDDLPRCKQYDMTLYLSNCELTPDDIELREALDDTRIETTWNVTIEPKEGGNAE